MVHEFMAGGLVRIQACGKGGGAREECKPMVNRRKSFHGSNGSLYLEHLEGRIVPSLDVTRYHYDNQSTGADLSETQLAPSNVNPASFGKLYSTPVDGQVYAEPLVLTNVTITGGAAPGTYAAVAFVATENDSLYAIDAATGNVLWQRTFLDTTNSNDFLPGASSVAVVSSSDVSSTSISPAIGITATPVIDPSTNTCYVCVKTKETVGSTVYFVQRLHAINAANGSDRVASFLIGNTTNGNTNSTPIYVNGSGDGNVHGVVQFNALRENSRSALSLVNGVVYAAWASYGDIGPYHGWVAAWNVSNLTNSGMVLAGVLCTSPNGGDAGIWGGGGGLVFEADGSAFYFETGNGTPRGGNPTFDANGFPTDDNYYESLVKVVADPSTTPTNQNPNGWGFKITDYFTPYNVEALDEAGEDFGSGSPLILPDSAGSPNHPHLMVAAGKEGRIYVLDRDNLGKFNPNGDNVLNAVPNGTGQNTPPVLINGALSTPAYYHGELYWVSGYSNNAQAYVIGSDGTLQPVSETANNNFGYVPGSVVVSANGSEDPAGGIVWIMDRNNNELHAYSSLSLSTELWNSKDKPGDALDSTVKFAVPTVANGQVFVGTSDSLTVYGETSPPGQVQAPDVPSNVSAQPLSGSTAELTWTDSTVSPNFATSYIIQDSTDDVHFATVATAPQEATSYTVTALSQSTKYYFQIAGSNGAGTSSYSAVASAMTTNQTGQTPTAPVGLGATPAGPAQVFLSWDNTASNETGFTLTRATDSNFTHNVVTQTLGATPFYYTDTATGLNPGSSYYYKINASNASGLSSSSNVAFVTIPQVPPQPTNASAVFEAGTQVLLSWTDNAGPMALGYQVFRSVDGGAYELYQNLPETSNSPPSPYTFTDTSVTLFHAYGYEIEAHNVSGFSAPAIATASLPTTAATFVGVTSPLSTAVHGMTITFSGPVHGFTLANLELTAAGSGNLLTSVQTVEQLDPVTWRLHNLVGLTSPTGRVAGFTLSLNLSGITDVNGNPLSGFTATTFIEVDPSLTLTGTTLTVPGTGGNDMFTFQAGSSEQATLNGVAYAIDPDVVSTVQYQGNGGSDTAFLNAAGTGNVASLGSGSGSLQGTGYTVSVTGVTNLMITAADRTDSAYVQVPSGAIFAARPGYAYVSNGAMVSEVNGFTSVQATAAAGSSASAYLYDNGGTNTFGARPGYAYQIAGSIITRMVGFQSVQMSASANSSDSAYLFDNGGVNILAARPGYAYQSAGSSLVQMIGFQSVQMTASAGSRDSAYLYDNGGSNTFAARPGYAYLSAGGTLTAVTGFLSVQATAASNSTDSAYLYDSNGSNLFAARPGYAFQSAGGVITSMVGFQSVQITAAAGTSDSAYLYDTSGINTYMGQGALGTLSGTGYTITVIAFKRVTANGAAGATNRVHTSALNYIFSTVGQWLSF
jgi:hypothetical protein